MSGIQKWLNWMVLALSLMRLQSVMPLCLSYLAKTTSLEGCFQDGAYSHVCWQKASHFLWGLMMWQLAFPKVSGWESEQGGSHSTFYDLVSEVLLFKNMSINWYSFQKVEPDSSPLECGLGLVALFEWILNHHGVFNYCKYVHCKKVGK